MESKPQYTHTEMIGGIVVTIALVLSYRSRKTNTQALLSQETAMPYVDQLKDLFFFGLETASYGAAAIIIFALLIRIFDKRHFNWNDLKNFSIITLLSLFPPLKYIAETNPYWQEIGAFLAGGISAFAIPGIFLLIIFFSRNAGKHITFEIEPGSKFDKELFRSPFNFVILFTGFILSPLAGGMIYDLFRDSPPSPRLLKILEMALFTLLVVSVFCLKYVSSKRSIFTLLAFVFFLIFGVRLLDEFRLIWFSPIYCFGYYYHLSILKEESLKDTEHKAISKIPDDEKKLYAIPFIILSGMILIFLNLFITFGLKTTNLFWGGFSYAMVIATVIPGIHVLLNQKMGYPDFLFIKLFLFYLAISNTSKVYKVLQNSNHLTFSDHLIIQTAHALPYIAVYCLLFFLHRKNIIK